MAPIRTLILALVAAGLSGCISIGLEDDGPPPEIRFHRIEPSAMTATKAPPSKHAVAVAQFVARERYDVRVVVRHEDGTVRFLEFERWTGSPDESISVAVRETLARAGVFRRVSDAVFAHPSTLTLDGQILTLDLLRPAAGPWRVELGMRLELGSTHDGDTFVSSAHTAIRDLPGEGPDGLGAAASACVADIVGQAVDAWRKAGVLN